jgi:hypothetical protein
MSVLRPLLSRRGRLVFVAVALLLVGALVAAPSVSGAKPASVKQFIASISAGGTGSLTMAVTNCGGPPPVPEPCNVSSTIDLGSVRINDFPTGFEPNSTPPSASSPDGRAWTASVVSGNLDAHAEGGNDKLHPGETVLITWYFDASATPCTTATFPTAAWGSIAISGSEPFTRQGDQPALTCVTDGGTANGPNGQTETVSNFDGTLIVTFGGDLDCSFDPIYGAQWEQFHLPTQVNILPGPGFDPDPEDEPKISTSKFPTQGFDSSSYLICYASPTTFATRGGTAPHVVNIGGTDFFVGILPNCYDPISGLTRPEPCVSEQFLELSTNKIVISVRMPPEDPHKR